MRTFHDSYMTIAEYRQLAERWARQIAEERRVLTMKPPRFTEVFECALVSDLVSDGDYG